MTFGHKNPSKDQRTNATSTGLSNLKVADSIAGCGDDFCGRGEFAVLQVVSISETVPELKGYHGPLCLSKFHSPDLRFLPAPDKWIPGAVRMVISFMH